MARLITAAELKRRMDASEDVLLVDLMPPSQYLLLHIPGAVNIPLDSLHEVLEYLPHDKDIILYCTNDQCEFSQVGAEKLELHGFSNVVVFKGGLEEWEEAGHSFATILLRPVEADAAAAPPSPAPAS